MRFLFDENAGAQTLELSGESFEYLFRVRRTKQNEAIELRNMRDDMLYSYAVESVEKKSSFLRLLSSVENRVSSVKNLHLIWCIIDQKIVEKTVPALNELGVKSISFAPCSRSQRQFKPNIEKLEKIALNSCQQCGRSTKMSFETLRDLDEALLKYPEAFLIDFGGKQMGGEPLQGSYIIGAEGGFCDKEKAILASRRTFCLNTQSVLRSETAAAAVASLVLLS